MKHFFSWVLFSSMCAFAQQPLGDQTPPPPQDNSAQVDNPSTLTSLAGQFLHGNFVNFYAFANAIRNSNTPLYNGGVGPSYGFDVGGGVDLNHGFETGVISLAYRGDYRDYTNSSYSSGTNQNLALTFGKRIARRWTFSLFTSAGIALYGGNYYSNGATGPTSPLANPFSSETRFLSTGMSLAYQQTRRLSYAVTGSFFLTRYNYANAIGTTGGAGAASATYRLTARTSLSGTFSHSTYHYQQNVGDASVNSVFATVSHLFNGRTRLTVSGGIAHANSQGEALLPVGQTIIDGMPVTIFNRVPYKDSSWIPAFQGTLSHGWRGFQFNVAGGQTVTPGNGIYLTSRDVFLSGSASRSWRRSNVSAGGGYFHLVSASLKTSHAYNTASFSLSYGYAFRRYLGFHAGYTYFNNGSIGSFTSQGANTMYAGITFSSKSIPMTLF